MNLNVASMTENRQSVLIFANGIMADPEQARPYLARAAAVIAADGGLRHLLALDHRPDVLVGDLDSLPLGVESELDSWATEVVRHPPAKNETDLELALLLAHERYPAAEIIVLGGFGGRLDMTLANVLLSAHPRLLGHPVRFVEGRETAWLVRDWTAIDGRPGDAVSLIPVGGPVRLIATTGLRWPLRAETLEFGPARGISNEMTTGRATVELTDGLLLCIHTVQTG